MPLFKRFIGSFRDKVLILIIFFIGLSIVEGVRQAQTKGFTYLTLLIFSPSDYSYIKPDILHVIDYGYLMEYSPQSEKELQEKYENTDVERMVTSFDLTITFSFILLNLLYYLLSEIFLGASVGKHRMKGRLVDNLLGERITTSDAFKRAIIGGFLMSLAVGIRFLFDTSYIIVIIMFFIIIDIPLFFGRRSLIDILSKSTYVECQSDDSKGSGEIVVVEEKKEATLIKTEKMLENTPIQYTDSKKQWKKPFLRIKGFSNKKKALIYVYLIWLAINIIALACGTANPHRRSHFARFRRGEIDTSGFFPFDGGIGSYDFSEFIVYTLAIPLCLFAMIKLYLLFVPRKK